MSTPGVLLHGFAYGEHLEETTQRSLGFRMLAPLGTTSWLSEIEALARQFQAAPYPDHWPPCELFCSVLLAEGKRLIALARYGLFDHTTNPRRGGLELVGVVGPAEMPAATGRALYAWLKQRRAATEDLETLGGDVLLEEVLATAPPVPVASSDSTPVLPVRLWREGVLLFASTAPTDPDLRLNLLEQEPSAVWQWLPLVGVDFPLSIYAERGPVIAWTPHLSAVAVKLDPHRPQAAEGAPRDRRRGLSRWVVAALLVVVAGLAAGNLWQTAALSRQLTAPTAGGQSPPELKTTGVEPRPSPAVSDRERFAEALYELLVERGGRREWAPAEPRLLDAYEQLVRDVKYRELRLPESSPRGRLAVGAVDVLSRRSVDRVEETVRKVLENNKLDPKVIQAVVDAVHEQLVTELKEP